MATLPGATGWFVACSDIALVGAGGLTGDRDAGFEDVLPVPRLRDGRP